MTPRTRSSTNTSKRSVKFYDKPLKKKRTSVSRDISVEPSPATELSEGEIEYEEPRDEPRDIQHITERSDEDQIDVFVSPDIFSNRQEYVICCFVSRQYYGLIHYVLY